MSDQVATGTEPLVSIVLVNYRGAEDTITCLRYFEDVDWPTDRLELIVVDNDSGDGSEENIREAVPHAEVYQSGANLGFAGGCNFGVEHSHGRYVGFINNDARPDRAWVREAVSVLEADPGVGAVASKVLDWDGRLIDYVDGSLTWFGMGYKRQAGWPDSPQYDVPKNVLFGTGAAMFVPTDLFRKVGGFDDRFFMFYEDVDLGWRLNLLGYDVRYVPTSLAFHRHHVTMKKFGNFRESYLLERNALMSLYKNLGEDLLRAAFGPALALAVKRSVGRAPLGEGILVPKMAMTSPFAIAHVMSELPSLTESRRELQSARRRTDEQLLPLFREAIEPAYPIRSYLAAHEALVQIFDLSRRFHASSRVLVVTGEPISEKMAGPAIRAWEMAKELSRHHEVRLASTFGVTVDHREFSVVSAASERELREHTDWADIIVFQGFLLESAPWLLSSEKVIVADIYDPMHLEQLEQARDLGEHLRDKAVSEVTDLLNRQIRRADLMLCASEKQQDFWLGQLAAQGRVNVATMPGGEAQRMLRVVPFGLDNDPPSSSAHGIRGTIPGIGPADKVVLWGGGVYNWFDPLTLVRAVYKLSRTHGDIRLVFMGMKHPNPGVPDQRIAWETRELSDSLGLTNTHVFFNSGWVPYRDRANFLLDADVGVSTHFEHVETAYSFRTRILDYLWAGLPIVATIGDSFGNVLEAEGIGRGVRPGDLDALADALEEVLYDDVVRAEMRTQVRHYAESFRWRHVLEPLVSFCAAPSRAPDLALTYASLQESVVFRSRLTASVRRDAALAREYLRAGGVQLVVHRAVGRIRRMRDERIT